MAVSPQLFGDISNRTAAYAIAEMLKRGQEEMILEKLGQMYTIPTRSTKTAIFRRYEALALATTPLVEGVTPTGKKLTVTDVTANLLQYGDFIPHSDVIEDTHEDPYLQQAKDVLTQQFAETVETIRYNVVKAGTNIFYANGTGRGDVNTVITLAKQRAVTKALLRQRAKPIKPQMGADSRTRTEPLEAAFVAVVHSDVANDIRNMEGFIPTKQYPSGSGWMNEIGSVENVRYVYSTLFTPFEDEGGAKGAMTSTSGTNADVYPVIYFAQDSFGIVPLKGKYALSLIVKNPGSAGSADPLNQRGTVGWKSMQTSVILNDAWLARLEVAVTA